MRTAPDQRPLLPDELRRYFEIVPALSEASINDALHIRHEVYARDLGFEPLRPDRLESDAYDLHALHCVVRTAQQPVRLAGCVRLVRTDPQAMDLPLPFERYCRESLDLRIIDPARLPRHSIAEVSRLAVMPEFRRRNGERCNAASVGARDFARQRHPRFPYIPISLYVAVVQMAQRHGIEHLFTLTEPRLAQHFRKLGVQIQAIGSPVEHRGLRVPSVIHVDSVYTGLRASMRPLWHAIHAQLEAAYALALQQEDRV